MKFKINADPVIEYRDNLYHHSTCTSSMATNQTNGVEGDHTEKSEFEVPYPVLLAQVSLGAMFVFMSVGWLLLTSNAVFDTERTFTEFFWALPAIFAVAVTFLLVSILSRRFRSSSPS